MGDDGILWARVCGGDESALAEVFPSDPGPGLSELTALAASLLRWL